MDESAPRLALVLPGGGARGAYQAGVLARLGEAIDSLQPQILTGVSAGAINATFLATHPCSLGVSGPALAELWQQLTTEQVVEASPGSLTLNLVRWGRRLVAGGWPGDADSLLDTHPLRGLLCKSLSADESGGLPNIERSFECERLSAVAISATNYCTGRAETFVHSSSERADSSWNSSHRVGRSVRLRVDHVMASAAIPILFPPVAVDGTWYGDGGIRQVAPLSPALHLGAERILVISTTRGPGEGDLVSASECLSRPSPARILGVLANSLLHDQTDYDAAHLRRVSRLAAKLPPEDRNGLRPVPLLAIRPSRDLGLMASAHESTLPAALRYLLRGWGRPGSSSSDLLSTLLFEGKYATELIECGRRDVEARLDEILTFLSPALER